MYFAHCIYYHEGVYDYEFVIFTRDLGAFNKDLMNFALSSLDTLYNSYSEYFNLAEYSGVLETLLNDSTMDLPEDS